MFILLHKQSRDIQVALNVQPQIPNGDFEAIEVAGNADTYEFPNGHAARCRHVDGVIVVNPDAPIPARMIYKSDILSRMTDVEIEGAEAARATLPLRQRLRWENADNNLVNANAPDLVAFFTEVLVALHGKEVGLQRLAVVLA